MARKKPTITKSESARRSRAQSAEKSTAERRPSDSGEAAAERSDASGSRETAADRGTEDRHALVARSAYLRAEARGFAPGRELDDWLEAEAELGAQAADADRTPTQGS
jgi:hypothetical protein